MISQQEVIEVTNFMSKSQINFKNSSSQSAVITDASDTNLCSVTAVITNQVA